MPGRCRSRDAVAERVTDHGDPFVPRPSDDGGDVVCETSHREAVGVDVAAPEPSRIRTDRAVARPSEVLPAARSRQSLDRVTGSSPRAERQHLRHGRQPGCRLRYRNDADRPERPGATRGARCPARRPRHRPGQQPDQPRVCWLGLTAQEPRQKFPSARAPRRAPRRSNLRFRALRTEMGWVG